MRISIIDSRYDANTPHNPKSIKLIDALRDLDIYDQFNLQMGGDGDTGESLAYLLDELIETGKIELKVN